MRASTAATLRADASGTATNRRWGSRHDFTPPPAAKHIAPSARSTRYNQGHARNGKGVGHFEIRIVQGGPSPVTMSSTPARKSQRPAVVTLGCEVSLKRAANYTDWS